MDDHVERMLRVVISNWNAMAMADGEESEPAADAFQASFYRFIDAVRDWFDAIEPRPPNFEAMMALPAMLSIAERLPAPLLLNFETEAELIFERKERIEDDKYD
ncbi:hypothetical protein ACFFNY_23675 [Paenibacillus hodogayensis]|uniref:Uncharacterized protein n=1 Tax=Paenibacillus hodogayensis TaxID=279208 RepID=A0ABV5W1Y4_9BACL